MADPDQLQDDLRKSFRGRLALDPVTRGLYATDASPFQVTPLGVAAPADAEDLQVLVRYCHEHAIPMVARGAGTGVAGESLGPGLVVDLSVHFRRITHVGPETVTAEPGVVYAELNAELAEHGRRFAPDPASGASCTVGGMVATNASGGNAARYGYTRDHVAGLGVVWDSGTADLVGQGSGARGQGSERTGEVRAATEALVRANQQLLHLTRPHTPFNRCGYLLHDVLTPTGLDLGKVLVGSEGTLGFVTSVTLRTVPLPGGTCVTLLGFPTVDAAARAALDLRAYGPVSCDLLDRRLLALSRPAGLSPSAAGAALVVAFEADTAREATERAWGAVEGLRAAHRLAVLADPTADPDGAARARAVRTAAVSGLYGLGAGPRPVAFIEDIGVPPDALPEFLAKATEALRRFDLTGSVLAHALAGQAHVRPLVDLDDPADRAKLWPVAEAVHALALALGGTVSTQHGTGIARTPWVERQYGPVLHVFRDLKRIFDPKNLLNPGKIVGPDPSRPAWPLRAVGGGRWAVGGPDKTEAPDPKPDARYPIDVAGEAAKCTGCGDCRSRLTAPEAALNTQTLNTKHSPRMCPAFRADGREEASPRARANLFRLPDGAAGDGAGPVAELCLNARVCRDECPAKVDACRLALAARAARVRDHGLSRADWVLARSAWFAAAGSNFAPVLNGVLGRRSARWVVEKLFGVSRRRRLPAFAARPFLRRGQRGTRNPERGAEDTAGVRVVYLVDTFANHADPLIGEAAVAVLRHHGVEVVVPARQVGCGMAPLAAGDVDAARAAARRNVRVLAPLVRDGYRVVCSEPTAALMLSEDYPILLDDPDAALVAANTVELTTFLGELHRAGRLRTDFAALDLTLGHHVPCHVKALRGPVAGPGLLALIPGVTVHTIDAGCSGMGGTWGLKAENFAASLAAGRRMFAELDRPRVLFGSTECGACRMQMQQGTRKRTLHPVQYLAYAYGLLPEVEAKLRKPLGWLVSD
ncbi:MAG: FAD-binding protein [Gemmataceae bacterium]|nr:FAD-binding protein [Gemmataceae bacterium]